MDRSEALHEVHLPTTHPLLAQNIDLTILEQI
jgi:hypothetical protein